MTPKEKANELVNKLKPYSFTNLSAPSPMLVDMEIYNAKKSALICVDEIISMEFEGSTNQAFYKLVKEELNKIV